GADGGIGGERGHEQHEPDTKRGARPHVCRPPSSPVGRTKRITTSRMYATASDTWVVRNTEAICSTRPSTAPPSSAPRELPRSPSTMTRNHLNGRIWPVPG